MSRFFIAVCLLSTIAFVQAGVSTLDRNYYTTQNQFSTQMFRAPIVMKNVMDKSLDIALHHCQESFQWQQWNCPSADFNLRRTSQSQVIDREDAYVTAISTAAVLYSITKDCSSGLIAGCGCQDSSMTVQCSDDPTEAENIFHDKMNTVFYDDFHSSVKKHNHIAIITLMRKSLITQCICETMGPTGCIEEICFDSLKPFAELAKDIRYMYDESVQLTNNGANSQIVWENVSRDAFVYVKDSPNYCEPDVIPHWNGMSGRQCSNSYSSEYGSTEENESCQTLCRACGLQVYSKKVIIERRCNCQLTWSFQLHCETCFNTEEQYYCY